MGFWKKLSVWTLQIPVRLIWSHSKRERIERSGWFDDKSYFPRSVRLVPKIDVASISEAPTWRWYTSIILILPTKKAVCTTHHQSIIQFSSWWFRFHSSSCSQECSVQRFQEILEDLNLLAKPIAIVCIQGQFWSLVSLSLLIDSVWYVMIVWYDEICPPKSKVDVANPCLVYLVELIHWEWDLLEGILVMMKRS